MSYNAKWAAPGNYFHHEKVDGAQNSHTFVRHATGGNIFLHALISGNKVSKAGVSVPQLLSCPIFT